MGRGRNTGVILRPNAAALPNDREQSLRFLHKFRCDQVQQVQHGAGSGPRWMDKHGPTIIRSANNNLIVNVISMNLTIEGSSCPSINASEYRVCSIRPT